MSLENSRKQIINTIVNRLLLDLLSYKFTNN